MVPPPVKSRLFMLTCCAGEEWATISSVICEPSETLGRLIGAPPLSMVTFWLFPLPLVVHHPALPFAAVNPSAAQGLPLPMSVIPTLLVGGIGLGSGGVG